MAHWPHLARVQMVGQSSAPSLIPPIFPPVPKTLGQVEAYAAPVAVVAAVARYGFGATWEGALIAGVGVPLLAYVAFAGLLYYGTNRGQSLP